VKNKNQKERMALLKFLVIGIWVIRLLRPFEGLNVKVDKTMYNWDNQMLYLQHLVCYLY
jgi:hypothetical protein